MFLPIILEEKTFFCLCVCLFLCFEHRSYRVRTFLADPHIFQDLLWDLVLRLRLKLGSDQGKGL